MSHAFHDTDSFPNYGPDPCRISCSERGSQSRLQSPRHRTVTGEVREQQETNYSTAIVVVDF